MENFFKDCIEASKEIYFLIEKGLDSSFYEYKKDFIGAGGDKSSKIDLYAEKVYSKYLKKYGKIISEESGEIGEGELKIILDPIDGSDNLLSNFPYFGSSIALKKDDEVIASFIVNLANGDFFIKDSKIYKKGTLKNSLLKDIKITKSSKIGLFEKAYANPKVVSFLKKESLKFRSPGAVALSLSYAHSVDFVLFIGKIREYDIDAGLHQCQDLNILYEKDRLLVSKDNKIFAKIESFLKERDEI